MRVSMGLPTTIPRRLRLEHVVPLAMHLLDQSSSLVTGQVLKATDWNRERAGQRRVRINTIGYFFESPEVGAFLWALAREAELCYATLALATDYDCWHEDHASVTVEEVVAVLKLNAANAAKAVRAAVAAMPKERACACASALQFAILTDPSAIPQATRKKLDLLLGKYLP